MLKFWFDRRSNTFDVVLNNVAILVALTDNLLPAALILLIGAVASRRGEKALAWEQEHRK